MWPPSRVGLARGDDPLSRAHVASIPCRHAGLACVGQLTRSVGWLTDPGDGSMGYSSRVMNSTCVCVYIYIYIWAIVLIPLS
jgi:hypothetical protein